MMNDNDPLLSLGSEDVVSRILENATGEYRRTVTRPDGTVEPPPSPLQVAAVLRALSDLSLSRKILGEEVRAMGNEKISDPEWREADGLGHFFNTVATNIERNSTRLTPAPM